LEDANRLNNWDEYFFQSCTRTNRLLGLTEVSYLRPRQGSQWRGLDSDVPVADLNPETLADVGTRSPGFWAEMKMEGRGNSMEIEPQI
jgi:hypothetical protein